MKREEWIEQSKAKLDRWHKMMSEIEARGSSMSEKAKAEYHALAGKARVRFGRAKAQIAEAQADGTDVWESAKDRIHRDWEENKKGFEAVLEAMREEVEEPGGQRKGAESEVS
jgi:F0F1-type ATP synthase membrane subunit b/b'